MSVCLTSKPRQLYGGARSIQYSIGGCVTVHPLLSVITSLKCKTVPGGGVSAACAFWRNPGELCHGVLTKSAAAAAPATAAKAIVVRPGRLLTARSMRAPRRLVLAVVSASNSRPIARSSSARKRVRDSGSELMSRPLWALRVSDEDAVGPAILGVGLLPAGSRAGRRPRRTAAL